MCWQGEATLLGMKRWTRGDTFQSRTPILSRFDGACLIPGIVPFSRSSLEQDNGIPLTKGYKVTHLSQQEVPLQISEDNSFFRCDGVWCSELDIMLIYSESQGNGWFPQLLYLCGIGCFSRGPQSSTWGNRPYWMIIRIY